MAYVVAVDIGGTFTDLVAFDRERGAVHYTKSPTTYDNFVDGILDCFAKAKIAPGDATFVNHGTTLVINALIQRKGAKAALVTSAGFRDILEIARGNRPDPFDLHYQRDEPLIPRELRFEVPERIDAKGRDRHAARRGGARPSCRAARSRGRRGGRGVLRQFLCQPRARGARRSASAPATAARCSSPAAPS